MMMMASCHGEAWGRLMAPPKPRGCSQRSTVHMVFCATERGSSQCQNADHKRVNDNCVGSTAPQPLRVVFMQNCNPAATNKQPAPSDQQAICIGSSTFQLFKDGWRATQPRHPRIRPKSPELCICQNALVEQSLIVAPPGPSPASRALRHTRIFTGGVARTSLQR